MYMASCSLHGTNDRPTPLFHAKYHLSNYASHIMFSWWQYFDTESSVGGACDSLCYEQRGHRSTQCICTVLYLYMDWLVSHYTFINLILFVQHSAIFHAWTVDSSSVNARILIQWHNIRNISSEWTNNKMEFSRIDKLICDAGRYIVFIVENSNQR